MRSVLLPLRAHHYMYISAAHTPKGHGIQFASVSEGPGYCRHNSDQEENDDRPAPKHLGFVDQDCDRSLLFGFWNRRGVWKLAERTSRIDSADRLPLFQHALSWYMECV